MITLMELPYAANALEPFISAETLSFHHGAHHRTYVDNVNKMVAESSHLSGVSLEDMIKNSHGRPGQEALFNNAAQVWNHDFYWNSLCPAKGTSGLGQGPLKSALEKAFGGVDLFLEKFLECALSQFGSGWAWLVKEPRGGVSIRKTGNAELPLTYGEEALFTCDVWEHAYYLDYQNKRKAYVEAILHNLLHWEFVEKRYEESFPS